MAAAAVLKERNQEMCGVQSLTSSLLYSCHCEKQVLSDYHTGGYVLSQHFIWHTFILKWC